MKLKFREDYHKLIKEFIGENAEIDFGVIQNLAEIWKIKKDMTNLNIKINEKKIFILEWENTELKDGMMPYEKLKVVAGDGEANLLFYSAFFAKNDIKFKKGDIYCLSILGNFVKDGEIIQKIDDGEHEFQKITPSLLIKELWEEKNKLVGKLNLSEEDLKKKERRC